VEERAVPYAELDDLRLYYEELGDAAAPPLLLMHGGTGSVDDPDTGWPDLAPSFAAAYRVL
jgi:hypothetical protein